MRVSTSSARLLLRPVRIAGHSSFTISAAYATRLRRTAGPSGAGNPLAVCQRSVAAPASTATRCDAASNSCHTIATMNASMTANNPPVTPSTIPPTSLCALKFTCGNVRRTATWPAHASATAITTAPNSTTHGGSA